jgi:menaquinone-dependent protoporphyrinogen oxidase
MIILIAYATIEGHTRKIAEVVASEMEALGHKTVIADLNQPGFAVPANIDAAILCAPIHGGRYPQPMIRFIQDWKQELTAMPAALVTVSLAIASQINEERKEALGYPERLVIEAGWAPPSRHNAAGALKYLEYDFFKRWVLRRIAEAEGGPVDVTRDHELTDWKALTAFAKAFVEEADTRV